VLSRFYGVIVYDGRILRVELGIICHGFRPSNNNNPAAGRRMVAFWSTKTDLWRSKFYIALFVIREAERFVKGLLILETFNGSCTL